MFGNFFQKKNNANGGGHKSPSPDNIKVFKLNEPGQSTSSRSRSPKGSTNQKFPLPQSPRSPPGNKTQITTSLGQNNNRIASPSPSGGLKNYEQQYFSARPQEKRDEDKNSNRKDQSPTPPPGKSGQQFIAGISSIFSKDQSRNTKPSPERSRNNKFVNEPIKSRNPIGNIMICSPGRTYGSNSPPKHVTPEPIFSKRHASPPAHSNQSPEPGRNSQDELALNPSNLHYQALLIKKKAPGTPAMNEEFVLHAKKDNFEKCIEMISGNFIINTNHITSNGLSALDYAIENSNHRLVFLLLSSSSNPNRVNPMGLTPLMVASKK